MLKIVQKKFAIKYMSGILLYMILKQEKAFNLYKIVKKARLGTIRLIFVKNTQFCWYVQI